MVHDQFQTSFINSFLKFETIVYNNIFEIKLKIELKIFSFKTSFFYLYMLNLKSPTENFIYLFCVVRLIRHFHSSCTLKIHANHKKKNDCCFNKHAYAGAVDDRPLSTFRLSGLVVRYYKSYKRFVTINDYFFYS